MSEIYQPNSVFQPSQVVSSANTSKQIGEAIADTAKVAGSIYADHQKLNIQNNKYSSISSLSNSYNEAYLKSLSITDAHQRSDYLSKSIDHINKTVMPNVMPENEDYIKYMSNNMAMRYKVDVGKDVAKQNASELKTNLYSNYTTFANESSNAYRSGNDQDGTIWMAQGLNYINKLQKAGASPQQIANMRVSLYKNAYSNAAIGGYEAALKNHKGKEYRQNLEKMSTFGAGLDTPFKHLNANDYDEIRSQLDRVDLERKNNLGLTSQRINKLTNQTLYSLKKTGQASQEDINTLYEVTKDPDLLAKRLNDSKDIYKAVRDSTSGTLQQLKDASTKYNESIINAKDLDSETKDKAIAAELDQQIKLSQTDPVTYIENQPEYQALLKKHMNNKDFDKHTFRINYQRQKGLREAPLSLVEKHDMLNIINSLPTNSAATIYNAHLNSFNPDVRHYVQAQLEFKQKKNDAALNSSVATTADHLNTSPANAALISEASALKSYKDSPAITNSIITANELNSSFSDKIADSDELKVLASSGNADSATSYGDLVKKMAATMVFRQGISTDDAIDQSIKVLDAGKTYHGYFNSGHTYSLPLDVNSTYAWGAMSKKVSDIKDDTSNIDVPGTFTNSFGGINKKLAQQYMMSNSHWINYKDSSSSQNDGVSLMYTDQAGIQRHVLYKNKPVVITYDYLRTGVPKSTAKAIWRII